LGPAAQGLLTRVGDGNRHVQEAACSALATLEESAGPELLPRLPAILKTLAAALQARMRERIICCCAAGAHACTMHA
jgi:transportin-1